MFLVPMILSLVILALLTIRDVRRRDKNSVPLANAVYNPTGSRLVALLIALALVALYAVLG